MYPLEACGDGGTGTCPPAGLAGEAAAGTACFGDGGTLDMYPLEDCGDGGTDDTYPRGAFGDGGTDTCPPEAFGDSGGMAGFGDGRAAACCKYQEGGLGDEGGSTAVCAAGFGDGGGAMASCFVGDSGGMAV